MQSYRRRCWECRLNRRTNALSLSRTAPPAQRGSGGAGRRLPPSSFSADEAPSSGAGQTGHGSAGLVDCIDFRDNMILIQQLAPAADRSGRRTTRAPHPAAGRRRPRAGPLLTPLLRRVGGTASCTDVGANSADHAEGTREHALTARVELHPCGYRLCDTTLSARRACRSL